MFLSLSVSARFSIYCTVFEEVISQQGTQYNTSLCSDVGLHFHLNLCDQEGARERERKGEYFRPADGCNTVCANIGDHCLSFLSFFNQTVESEHSGMDHG